MSATSTAPQSPRSRLAIITGGTSGLGLACARNLINRAGRDWKVLLLARDRSVGERAVLSLNEEARRTAAEFVAVDLGSASSIRDFAEQLVLRSTRVSALVCNAGVQFASGDPRTRDGLDATFGINHFGHFILVRSLAALLTEEARIIVVASSVHDAAQRTGMPPPRFIEPKFLARPELDPTRQFEQGDSPALIQRRRYTTSKLCNLYFAYELDRRLRSGAEPLMPKTVRVNAFDPGLMPGTNLGRSFPQPQRFVWNHIMPLLRPLLRRAFGNVHTVSESGASLAELVDAPQLGELSGKYLEGTKQIRSSPESYDVSRAAALWAASEKMAQ